MVFILWGQLRPISYIIIVLWFQLCLIITFLGNISVSTLSTVTVVEGHNVTLICNVSSIYPPVISVTWKFNDIAIDTLLGVKYQGGSISAPSLFINNLNATNQGNYTCSATNVFNTRQAYVYLTLAGKYRFWQSDERDNAWMVMFGI